MRERVCCMHFHWGHPPKHQWDTAKRCGPWLWGQVLIQPSTWTVCDSGTSTAPKVGDLPQRPNGGQVSWRIDWGLKNYVKISKPPKQDLGVWISWGTFTLSLLCLHGAADQGQTAEEIAAAEAAKREGDQKQCYLKTAEALKDHLQSHALL